mmetsp:Transcript_12838/g.30760  ORF Transcript_12838/g.30760 Transcript_12838/m.30760 type:complete len:308 (-) Transcript_12838:2106-3029(-)
MLAGTLPLPPAPPLGPGRKHGGHHRMLRPLARTHPTTASTYQAGPPDPAPRPPHLRPPCHRPPLPQRLQPLPPPSLLAQTPRLRGQSTGWRKTGKKSIAGKHPTAHGPAYGPTWTPPRSCIQLNVARICKIRNRRFPSQRTPRATPDQGQLPKLELAHGSYPRWMETGPRSRYAGLASRHIGNLTCESLHPFQRAPAKLPPLPLLRQAMLLHYPSSQPADLRRRQRANPNHPPAQGLQQGLRGRSARCCWKRGHQHLSQGLRWARPHSELPLNSQPPSEVHPCSKPPADFAMSPACPRAHLAPQSHS